MREPTSIQRKIWKAFGTVGKKLPSGQFRIYRPTQFEIDPIQDLYLRGSSPAFIEEKKASSNPFGGLTEYILYLNARLAETFIIGPGDYLWDQINDLTYVVTNVKSYDDIIGIELPNRVSISRTVYATAITGTEAQLDVIVESLPCVVEFGAFFMGGVVPALSPSQGGYEQATITTAVDPSLINLGDIVTYGTIEMSVLEVSFTPETPGAIIHAKVMG